MEARGQFVGVGSIQLLCGFQVLNLHHQVGWETPNTEAALQFLRLFVLCVPNCIHPTTKKTEQHVLKKLRIKLMRTVMASCVNWSGERQRMKKSTACTVVRKFCRTVTSKRCSKRWERSVRLPDKSGKKKNTSKPNITCQDFNHHVFPELSKMQFYPDQSKASLGTIKSSGKSLIRFMPGRGMTWFMPRKSSETGGWILQ